MESSAGVILIQSVFWLGWLIVLTSTFMISHFELIDVFGHAYQEYRSKVPMLFPIGRNGR